MGYTMIDINKFFDKIIVLSPERNIARRRHITNHFHERGITNWQFFTAMDYKFITKEVRDCLHHAGYLAESGAPYLPLPRTEISCRLSFTSMLIHARSKCFNRILFIEDDIIVNEDYAETFDQIISHVPDDWDTIHFHSHQKVGSGEYNDVYRQKINKYIYKGFSEGAGSLCVGFTKRCIDYMIGKSFPIHGGIDGLTNTASGNWFKDNDEYVAYISTNFMCMDFKEVAAGGAIDIPEELYSSHRGISPELDAEKHSGAKKRYRYLLPQKLPSLPSKE